MAGGTDGGSVAAAAAGKSRFTQWFGYDKAKQPAPKCSNNAYDFKSTPQQFFDYHQKANQKRINVSSKFRSVDELEANWHSGNAKAKESNNSHAAVNMAIKSVLAQLAQLQRPTTSPHSNLLSNLMNKNANIYQYRMSQSALMERPDAQLLLHRLVNGEITQFHILQQLNPIGNPTLHERDRETLMAVFKFCNENQQWLRQQQEQQQKQKQQMSQQFRLLQLFMNNQSTRMQPPLQATTQAFMQNAMYKKQYEDLQLLKTNLPPKFNKFQPYKGNQPSMPNQYYQQQYSRANNRGYYQKP